MARKPTVAIIYGFAEGTLMSKKFRYELVKNGYEICNEPEKADYIIAHSGGIFLVPKKSKARKIILESPSIATLKEWMHVQSQKVRIDLTEGKNQKILPAVLFRNLINGFYLLIHPIYHYHMLVQYYKSIMQLPIVSAKSVVVITHANDPWTKFTLAVKKKYPKYQFVKRSGVHDDLWMHPKYYVGLLSD